MLWNLTDYATMLPFNCRHVTELHRLPNDGCQVPQSGQTRVAFQQTDGPRTKLGYDRYTKNLHRPKAFIIERYIAEEAIEFCSEYIEKAKPVGLPESRHDERVRGKGSRGLHVITRSVEDLQQAHLYVLNNSNEFLPYIVRHEGLVKQSNPKMSKN